MNLKRVIYEEANWTQSQQDALRQSINNLRLCACGSGTAYEIVLLVLKRSEQKQSLYDAWHDAGGRWVEFAAKVLDGAGLLEHGTGIGFAWLTDEGKEVLRFLEEFGTDDDKWPRWATMEEYE